MVKLKDLKIIRHGKAERLEIIRHAAHFQRLAELVQPQDGLTSKIRSFWHFGSFWGALQKGPLMCTSPRFLAERCRQPPRPLTGGWQQPGHGARLWSHLSVTSGRSLPLHPGAQGSITIFPALPLLNSSADGTR